MAATPKPVRSKDKKYNALKRKESKKSNESPTSRKMKIKSEKQFLKQDKKKYPGISQLPRELRKAKKEMKRSYGR